MDRRFLIAGAICGGLAVALGSFGAHSLESFTDDKTIHETFQTGVQYQFYHSLALLATGIIYDRWKIPLLRWAGILFLTGIILFSGSLYLFTAMKVSALTISTPLGLITPLGGICFITGWVLMTIGIFSIKRS